ncbi:MAG: DUF2199 domain-containing protein [Planctomycetes bacterium]|nr:DUF2199 domain-containing protein [Planctomycetota bacterium]
MDIGANYPDPYAQMSEQDRWELGWVSAKENPDFCRIKYPDGQIDHFIRGVLEMPILDADSSLVLGVWATLSEANWNLARATWDEPDRTPEQPMFGWLSTWHRLYPDINELGCDVRLQTDSRPLIRLHDANHPMVHDQHQGITRLRLAEIVHSGLPAYEG